MTIIASLTLILFVPCSCAAQKNDAFSALPREIKNEVQTALASVRMSNADRQLISEKIGKNSVTFITLYKEVREIARRDPDLLRRVDKTVALPSDFVPKDLVALDGAYSFVTSKKGMLLRAPVRDALNRMAHAARSEGVTLVVSSTYRSYSYQKTVFERTVQEMGKTEAERVSARPGMSQHQLGTVIDFGSITDEFAQTTQSRWLAKNASTYGFSLSFPRGMEPITGYVWESWHYRFISQPAAHLQDLFFLGVQQYLIEFLSALPS
jgi:D-alanyl-D-alanine carboxypeptidase